MVENCCMLIKILCCEQENIFVTKLSALQQIVVYLVITACIHVIDISQLDLRPYSKISLTLDEWVSF